MSQTPEQSPEENVVDLWIAVYGEPPPVHADVSTMLGALVSGLPMPDWRDYLTAGPAAEPPEA